MSSNDELIEPHRTIRLTLHLCEPSYEADPLKRALTVRLERDEAISVYRSLKRMLGDAVD